MKDVVYHLNEINTIAAQVLKTCANKKICFHAEMGTGKTTLIKAIVEQLGATGSSGSPTFGIVNEYENNKGDLIAYHFDFYRLNSAEEALDFGIEYYFEQNAYTLMEWPNKVDELLPEDCSHIYIEIITQDTRKITVKN